MTTHNDFNDDNDDFTRPTEGSGETDSNQLSEGTDGGQFEGGKTADEPAGAENHEDESDVDLPQLLRQVSHVLRREFRSAAADSGFDPRDFGRGRRGRRRWDADDVIPDGAPYSEGPGGFGPPWARGGRGPAKNVSPEELRQRLRDLRDGVGERVEDVLTSEEFEHLKASLSKIVDAFGTERCGGDHDASDQHGRGDHDDHEGHDSRRDHEGRRGRDDEHRGGGRGRRGFGPNFGPGFGPGGRGFDPFGWADERRSREQEIQEAFERGFAAGFEQGRNS